MFIERFLTDAELLLIDPTGRGRATLARMVDGPYTSVPTYLTTRDRAWWFDSYLAARTRWKCDRHHLAVEWDEAHDDKYGGQGDSFSLREVKEVYSNLYKLAERRIRCDAILLGRDFFIRELKECIAKYGYPQLGCVEYVDASAALPTMLKKGDFVAETFGASRYRHVKPMLPGQRSQRRKHRVINQDSVLNVRLWERELTGIRNYLKTYFPQYFSAWLRPDVWMTPNITRMLADQNLTSVELDYKACDEHTSLDLVQEVVLPMLEPLFPSEATFVEFAAYVEELFYQPIFFGDTVWEGKHNLFSGQNITNDFETYIDLALQLGCLIRLQIRPSSVLQLMLGDDQSVVLPGHYAKAADELMSLLREEAEACGHECAKEKCAIRQHAIAFCRKLYYPQAPKDACGTVLGVYPTILTLNNVVNPERYQPNTVQGLLSLMQRLDAAYGSPWFKEFVEFVGSRVKWNDVKFSENDTVDIHDWWLRVYGERWSCGESPSFAVLKHSGLLN